MIILNQLQIKQKIKRMAMEIYERHSDEKQVYLAGINHKGLEIARMLEEELIRLSPLKCEIFNIRLNPAAPTESLIETDLDAALLKNKVIILTDDVSNTGRTLFYAFKPLMEMKPRKIEVAVLIERTHKCFPVHVDIVGLRLATTIKENIEVLLDRQANWKVQLN
jgi:pyrimidine operon attenuation protein / uracil phosphoribosyltransferase